MSRLRHFPFDGTPHRPQMGLRPLDLHDWIEIDEAHAGEIAQRAALLAQRRDVVLGIEPGAEAACLELYGTLRAHLLARFPGSFAESGRAFVVRESGGHFFEPASGAEALTQMGHWVQEDFCLLSPAAPVRLEAGLVCFPSRWSLAEKMGRGSDAIHGPVPKFEAIAGPTASILEKLQAGKPLWRLNWTIHDSDELFAPGAAHTSRALGEGEVLGATFLRVERQTLRRLPLGGYVVFTIRTYVTPMSAVVADPERRRLLAAAVRSLSDESAAYKGMGPFFEALKRAL